MADTGFLRRGRTTPRRRRPGAVVRWILLGTVCLALAAGIARLLTGSFVRLRRIEVSGNQRAATGEILESLAPWRSANLVTLELAPLASRLMAHPWIDRVTLAKRFPDGLEVRVVERRPVAILRAGEQLLWLGREGRPIAPFDSRGERGEAVLVSGEQRLLPELVALLEDLRADVPEYFSALSEIDALPDAGFGMMDSIFRRPVRVLRRDAPEKLRALLKARGLIESRGWEARAIDLRFADQIVLVGAYGAGNSL